MMMRMRGMWWATSIKLSLLSESVPRRRFQWRVVRENVVVGRIKMSESECLGKQMRFEILAIQQQIYICESRDLVMAEVWFCPSRKARSRHIMKEVKTEGRWHLLPKCPGKFSWGKRQQILLIILCLMSLCMRKDSFSSSSAMTPRYRIPPAPAG